MPTNKIVVKTAEEIMTGFEPVYQPVIGLFLGNSQSYEETVGNIKYTKIEAVGDLRAKRYSPKDTEIRQVAVGPRSISFLKYFFANQFTQSIFQDTEGNSDVTAQVLEEQNKQADELLFMGDGTSNATVKNNALFFSKDTNFVEKASGTYLSSVTALYDQVITNAAEADLVEGRKVVFLYGAAKALSKKLFSADNPVTVLSILKENLPDYTFVDLPDNVVPAMNASTGGWLIVNMDRIKLHYTTLPKVQGQGENDEMMYLWTNYIMGSLMVEVLTKGGVIKQPATVA